MKSGAAARELAETELRQDILAGRLVPGQRLIEEELAERIGVTRSSLRYAIDALVSEGLAERIANRGARVRHLSLREAVEITECRMVLEGLLARKAAERATPADVEQLRGQVAEMRQAIADADPIRYSALLRQLFAMIHEVARHPSAAMMVERFQAQLVRHQFQVSLLPGRPQRSVTDMNAVVEAIAAADADAAERGAKAQQEGLIAAIEASSSEHNGAAVS